MSERKELLTDHLCSIIEQVNCSLLFYNTHHCTEYSPLQNTRHYRILTIKEYSQLQNEQRKAKRLTELMVELQLDSSKILTDQVLVSIVINYN